MPDLFQVLRTVDRIEKLEQEVADLRARAEDNREAISYAVDVVWVFTYGKLPDRKINHYLTEHILNDYYSVWERSNARSEDIRDSTQSGDVRPSAVR